MLKVRRVKNPKKAFMQEAPSQKDRKLVQRAFELFERVGYFRRGVLAHFLTCQRSTLAP